MTDDRSDDVLRHIDEALDGAVWDDDLSADAMRWVPEDGRDGKDHLREDDVVLWGDGLPASWPEPTADWVAPAGSDLHLFLRRGMGEALDRELDRQMVTGMSPPCADVSLAGQVYINGEPLAGIGRLDGFSIDPDLSLPLPRFDPPRILERGRHTVVFEFRINPDALQAFHDAARRLGEALATAGRGAAEAARSLDRLLATRTADTQVPPGPRDFLARGSGRQTPPPWAAPPGRSRGQVMRQITADARHATQRSPRSGPRR